MSRPLTHPWLILKSLIVIFILNFLTACGGGSSEPSNLLVGAGKNLEQKEGSSESTSEPSQQKKDLTVSINHQIMLPAGGNTDVLLIAYEKDDSKNIANLPIVPNATFNITVTSPAVINGSYTNLDVKTDNRGQATFNLSHPGSGTTLINVRGTDKYQGGFSSVMYFGGSVTSTVIFENSANPTVPADGISRANVKVFVRDWTGRGVSGIPVDLSFSLDSFAVAVPPKASTSSTTEDSTENATTIAKTTDNNGEFIIGITNKVAQTVKVTPIAGGMASSPLTMVFIPAAVVSKPKNIDLIVKKDNIQPDGQSEASLVAVARDETGAPIPYIPIKITSNSATAVLKIGETTSHFFTQGNTGISGALEIKVTNTVEEEVTIVVSTNNGNTNPTESNTLSVQRTITFSPKEETTSGVSVGQIELDEPLNNNRLANGTDEVNLRGKVLDTAGNPVPGVQVSLILSGGSAEVKEIKDSTDSSGRFFASLTDKEVEEFKVKAVLGDISSNEVSVKFVAVPPPEGETPPTPPKFITLIAIPSQQVIDDGTNKNQIQLVVSVRDSGNTPMSKVKVSVSADSATALFDLGQQATDDGGRAVFKMTNTVAGKVTVTANAWVEDTESRPVGSPIKTSKVVTFTDTPPAETIQVAKLVVIVVKDKQLAAQDSIQIDVVAKDSQGVAVKGAPIIVLMGEVKAIARPALGNTDENGYFFTQISSTEAGKIDVTIAVENTSIAESRTIEFIAQPGELTQPEMVDLEVLNSPQPADGKSKITLIVVPRGPKGANAKGSPLSDIKVQLINKSIHAVLGTDQGTTDALGEFRTTITSEVPETFGMIPVAVMVTGNILGSEQKVEFTRIGSNAELTFNIVKDNQLATGEEKDANQIDVIARDQQGQRLSNVPVQVQIQFPTGGKAVAKSEQRVTNEDGLFTTKITSTQSGPVQIVFSIEGTPLIYPPITVTFLPAPGVTKPTTVEIKPVGTLSQIADPEGKAQIILIVIPKDAEGKPMPEMIVDLISDSTTAVIEPTPPQITNALGEARFTISDTVAHEVKVTPIADGIPGAITTLAFTPIGSNLELVVTPLNNEVLANGTDAININVVARNAQGQTVPNIPIIVQLPQNSAAVAFPFKGSTEAGLFKTAITSSVVGEVSINFSIENTSITKSIVVKFVPAKQDITPTTVEIVEVRNAPQPADGTSEITLKVIPRSSEGPIPDTNIELVSDPQQVVIKNPTGKTNALGEYQTTVTSIVAGTVNITPIAWKEEKSKITGKPTAITFIPIGVQVADLTVTPVGDKQLATGKDENAIRLDVVVRDSGGRPIAGVPIVVQLPTGTAAVAKSESEQSITDKGGLFSTKITSTVPGEVAVTVAIKDTTIAHAPVIITFVEPTGSTPKNVELSVLNAPQPADDQTQIILEVTTTDAKGSALSGVKIELIHDSNTAKLEPKTGETNTLGKFRATVTNSVAETFKVTPIAKGQSESDVPIIGTPVPITFLPKERIIPAKLRLTVEYEGEGRDVGNPATLTVFAYNEDRASEEGGAVNSVPVNGALVTLYIQPANEPSDLSYTTVKFDPVTGASGSTGNADGKGGNGTFVTKVSNSQPGTFKVVAKVTGMSLSSNVVDVSFNAAKTTAPDIKEINLISDYLQLGTDNKNAGGNEGVVITAILKDKDNNLVEGTTVRFSADSGEIQPIKIQESEALAGITDISGRAQARLTTKGNRHNRVITVTAKVSTPTGEKTATIPIKITGTTIRVEGGNNLILGGNVELTLTLVDAGNLVMSGEVLSVKSSLEGNTLNNSEPVTNASGQAVVTLTGKVPGGNVITVTLKDDKDGAIPGTHTVIISDHEFSIVPVPANADLQKIPLNTPQQFMIRWKKGGTPQALQQVSLSTTRGELLPSVTTDINGEALFTIVSKSAGLSQLKATTMTDGPSAQININFVAGSVATMTLQADPSTIGVNTPSTGQDVVLQQSKISAVLRDANNNLVEGKTVSFNLVDNTGGDLSPISTTTDKFGQASTTYTAGASSSASEGVSIIATVEGESNVQCAGSEKVGNGCAVKLTVALKRVFISLGTGNEIISKEVTYQYPYKVLATDINGAPIPNTEIVISAVALGYLKGYYSKGEAEKEGETAGWETQITAPKGNASGYCENEDRNSNGLLEPEEDGNQNGRLDPGGVVTFEASQGSAVKESTVKIKTGNDGYADFNLSYFKEMAHWVVVKITARSSVSGSEDSASHITTLIGANDDFKDSTVAPPARHYPNGLWGSPFGLGPVETVSDPKDPAKTVIDASKANCLAKE